MIQYDWQLNNVSSICGWIFGAWVLLPQRTCPMWYNLVGPRSLGRRGLDTPPFLTHCWPTRQSGTPPPFPPILALILLAV